MGRVRLVAETINEIGRAAENRLHKYDHIFGVHILSDAVDGEVAKAFDKELTDRQIVANLVYGQYPAEVKRPMMPMIGDAVKYRMWKRTKVVYTVDFDLWDMLDTMQPKARVFTGMFRDFKHPNPFVLFPEPVYIDDEAFGEGIRAKLIGMFVQGSVPAQRSIPGVEGGSNVRSTTMDNNSGIALTFIGALEDYEGNPSFADGVPDYMWHTIRIEMNDEPTTLADIAHDAVQRYVRYLTKDDTELSLGIDAAHHLPLLIRRAMGLLIYLCSSRSDIQEHRTPAQKSKRGRDRAKATEQVRLVEVGYRIGKAIRDHAQSSQGRASTSEGDGTRTVSAHMRQPHMHMYRVGKGRREIRILPIGWVEVNYGKSDEAEIGTIIPIKKPREK